MNNLPWTQDFWNITAWLIVNVLLPIGLICFAACGLWRLISHIWSVIGRDLRKPE